MHPVVGACKICTPVLNQVEIEIFLGEMGHLFEWKNKIGTYVYPKKRVELLQNGYSEAPVT